MVQGSFITLMDKDIKVSGKRINVMVKGLIIMVIIKDIKDNGEEIKNMGGEYSFI